MIEVRGDMRPFVNDLDKELDKASVSFEKRISEAFKGGLGDGKLGDETGEKLGDGIGRKLRDKLGSKGKPPWVNIAAAFASALDDGISALPTEVKAAIVGGLILATPLIAGTVASAISAGLGVGLAGIGGFLAFQYEAVQDRGEQLLETLRIQLVAAASSFVPAMLNAINTVEKRFRDMGPLLNRIFSKSAEFLEPVTRGVLDFIDQLLVGVDGSLDNVQGHVEELGKGLRTLGFAVGQAFKILADTGEDGREAFRDFIYILAGSILATAKLIAALTELYGWLRSLSDLFGFFNPLIAGFVQQSDAAAQSGYMWKKSNDALADSFTGPIKMTEEEAKRLRELRKTLDEATDATYGVIESQIDFERSLDNIREALQENGDTLKLNTEEGRRNAEEFLKGLKSAEEGVLNQMQLGKISSQQAADQYRQQIALLRQVAIEGGLTAQEFNNLYGEIISVTQLKLDAGAMGIVNTEAELSQATREAQRLYTELQRIRAFRLPSQGTRPFSEYAEGGIVSHPTYGLIGEAGPEVVIPLTKPQRAADLMRQSGLAGMLGAGSTVVNVYVGNEQLDARTYRIVESNNNAMSSSLAFGARGL